MPKLTKRANRYGRMYGLTLSIKKALLLKGYYLDFNVSPAIKSKSTFFEYRKMHT